jgi:phosphorylcholine metabolism protein LicD
MGAYKPPSMKNNDFLEYFTKSLDKCFVSYENIIIFGDFDFDMMCAEQFQILNDICDIFNLSQLVKGPTCFKKGCNPSPVDVIITNKKNMCFKTTNSPTGVSDCHNIISTVDINQFTNDLQKIQISENCTEKGLSSIYDEYEKEQVPDFEFNKVINKNVDNILNKINIKKATGADGIPAKIVKNCKSCIAPQLTKFVN